MINSDLWNRYYWITAALMIINIFICPVILIYFTRYIGIEILFFFGAIAFHILSLVKYRKYLIEEQRILRRLKNNV